MKEQRVYYKEKKSLLWTIKIKEIEILRYVNKIFIARIKIFLKNS